MKAPCATAAATALFLALACRASGDEEKSAAADLVVVAKVEDSRTIVHRKTRSALHYVRLKAKIESVEKGRHLLRGADEIDIRCWREGDTGHNPIPADGAGFRAFLLREDGGFWTPLLPDGFELSEGAAARTFPPVERRQSRLGNLFGALLGLAVICIGVVARYRRMSNRARSWSSASLDAPDPPESERRE